MAYGEGSVVAVLIPIVIWLVRIIDLPEAISLALALFGLWTIIFSVTMSETGEKVYYFGWGIAALSFSTAFVIPIYYSIAIILIVMIGIVIYLAYQRSNRTSTSPTAPRMNYCPNCGAKIDTGTAYCPSCGAGIVTRQN